MLGEGHARQSAHRLSLRAGGDHKDLIITVIGNIIKFQNRVPRNLKQTEIHRDGGYVHHAAAYKADLAAVLQRAIHHLLHAVNIAGKHGDDHAAGRGADLIGKGLSNLALGHAVAGPLDIGALAHQGHHAPLACCCQRAYIRYMPLGRSVVDLEVAAVNDGTGRGGDDQRVSACDGVIHPDKLDREAAQLDHLTGLHCVHLNAVNALLLELVADQGHGHP
ncbi:hypothetical protein SDC9_98806 [bioreactor metagenome]|uniref:Uncharacterized protein n=1 Tax=bioreactor metagenome TaxID=1076179 RepID=A0A645AMJ4_9ZZZZ